MGLLSYSMVGARGFVYVGELARRGVRYGFGWLGVRG